MRPKDATLNTLTGESTGLNKQPLILTALKRTETEDDNKDKYIFFIPQVLLLARSRERETRSNAVDISKKITSTYRWESELWVTKLEKSCRRVRQDRPLMHRLFLVSKNNGGLPLW